MDHGSGHYLLQVSPKSRPRPAYIAVVAELPDLLPPIPLGKKGNKGKEQRKRTKENKGKEQRKRTKEKRKGNEQRKREKEKNKGKEQRRRTKERTKEKNKGKEQRKRKIGRAHV